MPDRTVYLAQAGPKQSKAVFEQLYAERWEAESKTEQWKKDCLNPDGWWFGVSELEATA